MTSSNLNFQKSKKMTQENICQIFCAKFQQNRQNRLSRSAATHTQTHTHTLIHTPSVSVATYSVKMTEYNDTLVLLSKPLRVHFFHFFLFFPFNLYSVILTEYVAIKTEGVCMSVCVCVCMYVCASVCMWKLYSQNGCVDFDETLHK